MATATTEKIHYPTIPASTWWKLRQKFKERPPTVVNEAYLRGVLQISEKSARNYIPQLRRLGLINDDGKPTDLAYRWRDNQQYKEACEEIIQRVYPQTLLDVFHSPDTPREQVERWFANETKKGEAAAREFARVFLMLLDGDSSKAEPSPAAKGSRASKQATNGATQPAIRRAKDAASGKPATRENHPDVSEDVHDDRPHHAVNRDRITRTFAPAIHLDFNIHIASDSSAEQVDQIFASMAKHLRALIEADE